jgi:hypothetical protein
MRKKERRKLCNLWGSSSGCGSLVRAVLIPLAVIAKRALGGTKEGGGPGWAWRAAGGLPATGTRLARMAKIISRPGFSDWAYAAGFTARGARPTRAKRALERGERCKPGLFKSGRWPATGTH